MSEMYGDDDVGAVLGFLSGVLRMEMHQLRRDYRPHHFQQSKKESGCSRAPGRRHSINSYRSGSDSEPARTEWQPRLIIGSFPTV